MAMAVIVAVVTAVGALIAALCFAGVPELLNYQGKLTDDSGQPLTGTYDMTFKLWSHQTDTDPSYLKWTETWNTGSSQVTVTDGLFNVVLGSINTGTLGTVFEANDTLYLEITVGAETLSPRVRMGSAGYALNAGKPNIYSNIEDKTITGAPPSQVYISFPTGRFTPGSSPSLSASAVITNGTGTGEAVKITVSSINENGATLDVTRASGLQLVNTDVIRLSYIAVEE